MSFQLIAEHNHSDHYIEYFYHAVPPLQQLMLRYCRQSVDCCVSSPNGGHLRPQTATLSLFLMRFMLMPKMRDQHATRASLEVHACEGPIGSGSTMIWRRGGCWIGYRGQSLWGVGRWWLILVLWCGVCLNNIL